MTAIEETANRILQARGYLVVSCFKTFKVPSVIPAAVSHGQIFNHPLSIIAETDNDDFLVQAQMWPTDVDPESPDGCRYYRVVAE